MVLPFPLLDIAGTDSFGEERSAIVLEKSGCSVAGPISKYCRIVVVDRCPVLEPRLSSAPINFAPRSGPLLPRIGDGLSRGMVIANLPFIAFLWALLASADTSQGKVNCKIFPLIATRT